MYSISVSIYIIFACHLIVPCSYDVLSVVATSVYSVCIMYI